MSRNIIFILSHQDDEISIFNKIDKYVKQKKNILIFYLTSGSIKREIKKKIKFARDLESIKVLTKLGVKEKNIYFIGRELNIKVYELYKNYDLAFKSISKHIKKIKNDIIIYTHAWEGGNEDHDSCNAITKKLFYNFISIRKCYQFPFYHGNNMPFIFYRVQNALPHNGIVIKQNVSLINKFRFISYLFFYKSQIKIWFLLYPFLIFNLFSNKYGIVQNIKKNLNFKKPHKGKLLYEKRGFCDYSVFKKKTLYFFRSKI